MDSCTHSSYDDQPTTPYRKRSVVESPVGIALTRIGFRFPSFENFNVDSGLSETFIFTTLGELFGALPTIFVEPVEGVFGFVGDGFLTILVLAGSADLLATSVFLVAVRGCGVFSFAVLVFGVGRLATNPFIEKSIVDLPALRLAGANSDCVGSDSAITMGFSGTTFFGGIF